jgi:hypothetical protein
MSIGPRWASAVGLSVMLAALLIATPVGADAGTGPIVRTKISRANAFSSGTQSVKEMVRASLVSHHGSTRISEKGSGSGTYSCGPLTVQISVYGDTEAVVSFTCNTRSGSLSGSGTTSFAAAGATATFNGNLKITHGTGAFAHASTGGLHIQGSLARHSYALSARVTGTIHL